jgi:cyanophycin synthetase
MPSGVRPGAGVLMAIGGAEDKLGHRPILSRFVQLAGGEQARIVMLTTASSLGDELAGLYEQVFTELGAAEVRRLRPLTREAADATGLAAEVAWATGVFMTGGNQLRLSMVVGDTRLGAALLDAHRRGVVVAGTSAGASALCSQMVAFGRSGEVPRQRQAQLAAGLGFLPQAVIDQHFTQRNRLGRLQLLVAETPSQLGIGIDEDTAAIISANKVLEVLGEGTVTILDGSQLRSNAYEVRARRPVLVSGTIVHHLPAGSRFDLGARNLLPPSQAERPSSGAGQDQEEATPRRRGRRQGARDVAMSDDLAAPTRDPRHATKERRPRPDLTVRECHTYRGPNYWSYDKAVRLLLDLGSLEDWPSNTLPGLSDRLLELLPGLADHTCGVGRRGGFVERLREGTWLGHVVEHVALQLQREAGGEQRRGKTRSAGERGRYHVIYGYGDEQVGVAAGQLAVRLLNHLVEPEPGLDFTAELERFILEAERTAFGPSTQAIIEEAAARDIPWLRLDGSSLVQLGHGVHQQRIRAAMTSKTSALAVDVAGDKDLANRLLASAGLPVLRSASVRTVEGALAAARRLRFPVVVKPLDGHRGRGVQLDLADEAAVTEAFPTALAEARRGWVVVERCVAGNDYRVLVVGGKVVAVAERVPAHVIGDGTKTVAQLVEEANADPRRGVGHEKTLTRIRVDQTTVELVRAQGFDLDDVPPEGTMVKLTLTGNMSTGGSSIDRTDEAHPDNLQIAQEAARVVGLDVAGIDFIAPDIAESVRDTDGAIVEVTAAPDLRVHTHPTIGEPQYVAKPVVDLLFPPGTPSRIPIVAVTGTNGKTTTARMIAHIFKGMGRKVGLTTSDGILIDERLVLAADASGPRAARMVLQNPRVDFAVFEVARGGILREGLGYERNDVGIVLNISNDHLGMGGIDTLRQLAAVKQVVIDAVPHDGHGVLNADDPLVAAMHRHCNGELVYFSVLGGNELVDAHCLGGGRAIVLEDGRLGEGMVLRQGHRSTLIAPTSALPATFGGRARMNVANAMAAAAAAIAAGAHLHDIRAGLRSFSTSYEVAPGRLNLFDVDGYRVLVDSCHNAAAMRTLSDFVDRLTEPPRGADMVAHRRIGVIASPGDRRDKDIRELGEVAAEHFDALVVREDRDLQGRPPGESAEILASAVKAAVTRGARCRSLEVIPDEMAASKLALDWANPGDLVVLCADRVEAIIQELLVHVSPSSPTGSQA